MATDKRIQTSLWGFVACLFTRYRINLVLLVVLVVAVTIWFYLHIRPYVTRTLLVGTPLTIWSLGKLAYSFLEKNTKGEESLPNRVLGGAFSTECLFLGLILIAVLFIVTTSVYVEYDQGDGGAGRYEVDVKHDGRLYMEKLTVSSYERVSGRPFFFRFAPVTLTFEIADPYGYHGPVEATVRPLSRVYLRVPVDFPEKEHRIIRLIPGRGFWQQKYPRVDKADLSDLVIVISHNQKVYAVVENVLLETVYFGAEQQVIRSMIQAEPQEERLSTIRSYLTKIGWTKNPGGRSSIIANSRRICPTPELEPNREITVEVKQKLEGDRVKTLYSKPHRVSDTVGIQTIPIEVLAK